MKNKEQQFEKIENYLSGEMRGEDRRDFEQEVENDTELKMELRLQKEMHEYMVSSPKDDLRESLSRLNDEFSEGDTNKNTFPFRRWLLGFLMVLIGVAGWFFLSERDAGSFADDNDNSTTVEQQVPQNQTGEKNDIENKGDESGTQGSNNGGTKEEVENKKKTVPPRPIAEAGNYQLNPVIEAELGDNLRGGYEFILSEPEKGKVFNSNNGQLNFILKGSLTTDKIPEEDFSLLLEIYDNEEENYKQEKPALQKAISLSGESPFLFELNSEIKVQERFYYYLIKDDFSGVVLAGGKFKVE